MSTFPAIRLPHPVKVLHVHYGLYRWYCPACGSCRMPHPWAVAHRNADDHARHCHFLRRLNFAALACWNCNGTGSVSGDLCLVCLGARITDEPDPTKERHV